MKFFIRNAFRGLNNFWKFRKEIYNYRWYDYDFAHDIFRAILADMRDNWKNSHYEGFKKEEEILKKAVQILDEIKNLENEDFDEYDVDSELSKSNRIAMLYEKFGKLLFESYDLFEGEKEKEGKFFTCNFMRLWD